MKQFFLSLTLLLSASAFASSKGIVCTDDALPDGDKQDYTLEPNKDGSYTAYYQVQRGDMKNGVAEPSPKVVLAKGLTCSFGTKTPSLVDCSKKDKKGSVVAFFSTQLVTTISVSDGNEYSHTNYSVNAEVEKIDKKGDYPSEMNEHGYISADIISGDCEDSK